MEFRQIRYFLEIHSKGSFIRAAQALGLTQPALSRQISLLERETGFQLFDRTGRQIRLTSSGEIFYEQAVRMDEIWKETKFILQNPEGPPAGEFSLSSGGTVAAWILPGLIRKIRQKYPGLSFRVLEGDAQTASEWVIRGDVDLGILSDPLPPTEMIHKYFFSDSIVPFVSRDHPLARKKKLRLDDLRNQEFVFYHPASAIRRIVDSRMRTIKPRFAPTVVMELRGVESVLRCVEAGLGIGFASELSLNEKLKALKVNELTAQRKFYFCHRDRRRPGLKLLIETMEESFRELFLASSAH